MTERQFQNLEGGDVVRYSGEDAELVVLGHTRSGSLRCYYRDDHLELTFIHRDYHNQLETER